MRLKHNPQITPWFVGVGILGIPMFFDFSMVTVIIAYYTFQVLGIGLGLHRCATHGVGLHQKRTKLAYILGLLTHAGPLRGSAFDHARHHMYADTEYDAQKPFNEPSAIGFITLLGKQQCRQIAARFDKFDNLLDGYFYCWVLPLYLLGLWWDPSILIGAALATLMHNYLGGVIFHSNGKYGYRNFDTPDKSTNSILLFPLFLGDNWHNNHHSSMQSNYRCKWWEIDLVFWIIKLVGMRIDHAV